MKHATSYWIMIISLSVMWFFIGFLGGWIAKRTYNENALRNAAKEKFTSAITWAISENILTINSNRLNELKMSEQFE